MQSLPSKVAADANFVAIPMHEIYMYVTDVLECFGGNLEGDC